MLFEKEKLKHDNILDRFNISIDDLTKDMLNFDRRI